MFEQNVKQQVMKSKSEGIRETHNTEYNRMMWPLQPHDVALEAISYEIDV